MRPHGPGVGRGLTEAYLARPNHTVIAAVRDPGAATATSLEAVTAAPGARLVLVKLDSTEEADAAAAVRAAQAAGVAALDVVIANAGIAPPGARLDSAPLQDLRAAVEVNAVAPLALFQAAAPLLRAAAAPRFLVVSTAVASIQNLAATHAFPLGAYGASKAAVNYLVRRLAFENPWLNAFVMHPGCVEPPPPAPVEAVLLTLGPAQLRPDRHGQRRCALHGPREGAPDDRGERGRHHQEGRSTCRRATVLG